MPTIAQRIQGFLNPLPRLALRLEPSPLAPTVKASDILGYLRSAEQGDTRNLFTLYRDICAAGSHVVTELDKRKTAVLAEEWNVIPFDKKNPDDVKAADACKEMIRLCDDWMGALSIMLDSTLWPVSVGKKIWKPTEPGETDFPIRLRFQTLYPINPQILCFNPGYNYGDDTAPEGTFEPQVRMYKTDAKGIIDYSLENADYLTRKDYLVHRGHTMTSARDCWGGPMRAILGWWFLAECGRDWFARFMERYGSPFIVGKVNAQNQTEVDWLKAQFSEATKIGGIVIDHASEIELVQAATSANAEGFKTFLEICNREISKIILGQTLSADAQPTGLGSSVGKLHSEVRDDKKKFDRRKLNETIGAQLFKDFLQLNAIAGHVPTLKWGSLDLEEAQAMATLLGGLKTAGLQPTEEALPGISERVGLPIERIEAPVQYPDNPFAGTTETMLSALELFKAGNPFHRGAGDKTGGQFTSKEDAAIGAMTDAERAARAKASHVVCTAEKQRFAEAQESIVAKKLGGQTTGDNLPMDVVGDGWGIECKTIVAGKNDKITMHPESLARKNEFVKQAKIKGATVVIDARGKPPTYYSRPGFGSFRISSMTKHSNLNELAKAIKQL